MEREILHIEGDYDTREVRIDGVLLDPRPSQEVWNHSPDGFAWGYEGAVLRSSPWCCH